jgi:tetratricopeptide (TPR) repeat protein
VDPGVSLARAAEESLGRRPVERRTRGEEVWTTLFPRAAALVAIGLVVVILSVRIRAAKRPLLYWTALAPAALLAVDGGLAVHRTLSEPYTVNRAPDAEGWRRFEQLAMTAEREGQADAARANWARAMSAGGPPGPIEYEIGLAARHHGDIDRAKAEFTRALGETEPAPGAARELASLEAAAGRFAAAEPLLERYVSLAGPDPESLSLLAVVQTNLGKSAEALETIRRARSLVAGEGWRGEELEAQVHARAGDAAGTVAALRPLESQGLLNRAALRSDPAYIAIATDPVWVAFLNEKEKEK